MIRTTIKTSFACWIGIFLILPGCLCQLLACLGVDLHGEERSQLAFVAPGFASSLDCHCDDDTGKVAEQTPSDITTASNFAWLGVVLDQAAAPPAPPFIRSKNARAPPSGAQPPSASDLRALISVWLV